MIRRWLGMGSALLGETLILLVRVYQATLSPWLGRQCRFLPTCSNYFIRAVEVHGPLRGSLVGIWRICRCHPLAKGGFDPVPAGRPKASQRHQAPNYIKGKGLRHWTVGSGIRPGPRKLPAKGGKTP